MALWGHRDFKRVPIRSDADSKSEVFSVLDFSSGGLSLENKHFFPEIATLGNIGRCPGHRQTSNIQRRTPNIELFGAWDVQCSMFDVFLRFMERASTISESRIGTMNLRIARWRFGVRQSSGALAVGASRPKAPEDWRTPKPGGASDGSWEGNSFGRAGTNHRAVR
jgi:hypothetical protein